MEYFKSFIPGTISNRDKRIQEGLDFSKMIATRKNNIEKYNTFEKSIRRCQYGECPYTVLQLRDISNGIGPGMDCVCVVWDTCSLVGK